MQLSSHIVRLQLQTGGPIVHATLRGDFFSHLKKNRYGDAANLDVSKYAILPQKSVSNENSKGKTKVWKEETPGVSEAVDLAEWHPMILLAQFQATDQPLPVREREWPVLARMQLGITEFREMFRFLKMN